MCLALSQADEEKRSTGIDNTTMDHQNDDSDLVRTSLFFISLQLQKVADIFGRAHSGHYCQR